MSRHQHNRNSTSASALLFEARDLLSRPLARPTLLVCADRLERLLNCLSKDLIVTPPANVDEPFEGERPACFDAKPEILLKTCLSGFQFDEQCWQDFFQQLLIAECGSDPCDRAWDGADELILQVLVKIRVAQSQHCSRPSLRSLGAHREVGHTRNPCCDVAVIQVSRRQNFLQQVPSEVLLDGEFRE